MRKVEMSVKVRGETEPDLFATRNSSRRSLPASSARQLATFVVQGAALFGRFLGAAMGFWCDDELWQLATSDRHPPLSPNARRSWTSEDRLRDGVAGSGSTQLDLAE